MSAPPSNVIAILLHQLAVGQGRIESKVDLLLQRPHALDSSKANPTKGIDWKTALEIGRLIAKGVWWVTPKLFQWAIGAWLLMSGWAAMAWRWVQLLIGGG